MNPEHPFNEHQFRQHLLDFMDHTGISVNDSFVQLGNRSIPARSAFHVHQDSQRSRVSKDLIVHMPHESGAMISLGMSQNPHTEGGLSFSFGTNIGTHHREGIPHVGTFGHAFRGVDHLWDTLQTHRNKVEDVLKNQKLANWVKNENHHYFHESVDPEAPIYGQWGSIEPDLHVSGGFSASRNYQFKRKH